MKREGKSKRVKECVRACVRACVRECVRACVSACVHALVPYFYGPLNTPWPEGAAFTSTTL